jgi:hypothetical protein
MSLVSYIVPEILNSIEELYVTEEIIKDNTPVAKYQHPEAW